MPSTATRFPLDISTDHRPYVVPEVLGISCRGLLDSGSEISIIGGKNSELFTDKADMVSPTEVETIVTANGSKSTVSGHLSLPVTFKNQTRIIKFLVIPDVPFDFLYGIDFWKAFNIAPEVLSLLNTDNLDSLDDNSFEVMRVGRLHPFDSLSEEQKLQVTNIYQSFEEISSDVKGLGRTHLITHKIDTADAEPIKQRYYPMSPQKLRELNRQLDEMLALDVVEPSNSPWNNPVTMAPKANGELRFCLDSRKLNQVSKHDAYPLPYIRQILDQLSNCQFLSSIDLKSAFWQIPLEESSREKTAFTVPGRGLFQFKVMCFGLTSAPATQQRLMDKLFGPEFDGKVFIYLDDIIIISSSFSKHLDLLKRVRERLLSAGLTINLKKSSFFRKQLKYLGYVVDEEGLRTDPDKIRAIVEFPTPTSRKELKRFLGTASYYRRFIRNFSDIASPLNALTSTKRDAPPYEWSPAAETSFQALKTALTTAPVLACPDFSLPFIVHTDASEVGIGGMLTQVFDGEEHPVAYCSRSLSPAEKNYSATEREALAVVYTVEHYRPYLEGSTPFKIVTDHSSLRWFLNLKNPTGRLERWGCRLSPYNFVIEHRRGSENIVPDALSRSVPVNVITSDTTIADPWYQNIFNRCQRRPQTCPNFQIVDGKLYRYTKSKNPISDEFDWKEVVPAENREEVIRANHDPPTAGHFGIDKTYKRIRLRYYWPALYKDVTKYVSRCGVCKAYKHSNKPTIGLMGDPKVCRRPFQCISIDLVGPLPSSRLQNTFLLVIICCFTKYSLLFPIRRATGRVIAQRVEDHVFLVHGVPQKIICDNGPQFISQEVKSLFSKYNVPQVHYTPVYCPQVNTVERANRTVMTAISSLVGADHRNWDANIPKVQFAINTSVSDTTSYSPFLMVHGREAVLDGDVYGPYSHEESGDVLQVASTDQYVQGLAPLKDIFEKVRSKLKRAHERNAKYYNNKRRHADFAVGDYVWKRTYKLSSAPKHFSAKLAPKYQRCKILNKLSPLVYELEDDNGKNIGTWHVKDFKCLDVDSS